MKIDLKDVSNEAMKERLFTKENYELLEHLLSVNFNKLAPLYQEIIRKGLDYGPMVKKNDLEKILDNSLKDVENFLEVKIDKPKISKSCLISRDPEAYKTLLYYAGSTLMGFTGVKAFFGDHMIAGGVSLIIALISARKALLEHGILNRYHYHTDLNRIDVPLNKKSKEARVRFGLYHELGHVALDQKHPELWTIPSFEKEKSPRIFWEGFANSVSFNIMEQRFTKADSYLALSRKESNLRNAYLKMTSELNLPKSGKFDNSDEINPDWKYNVEEKLFEKIRTHDSTVYDYGATVFQIAEHKHPEKNIYRQILEGDLSVL